MDSDGVTVTTNATTLLIEEGARVSAPSRAAVTVAIDAPSSVSSRTSVIKVDGSVDGGSSAGIALTDGALPSGYYGISTRTDITVGETGSVTGAQGILLGPVAGVTSYTFATLDNAGTISGTAGAAVQSRGNYVTFTDITNRATGTIYGLSGAFGTIDNAGLIDGGSGSAIARNGNTASYPYGITNSGRIVSSGSAATIYDVDMQINNSGEIANTGTGAAVSGTSDRAVRVINEAGGTITSADGSTLTGGSMLSLFNSGTVANLGSGMAVESTYVGITNEAGGTIQSAGTAISASGSLSLVNEGTIIGDVLAGSSSSYLYSSSNVDSTGGTIEGDLIFGAAQDTLHALYTDTGELVTGVTGTIDGGVGTDRVEIDFTADRTLATAIVLPTNFEDLALVIDSGATVTLADGFSNNGAIALGGSGTLRNETSLTGVGSVITTQIALGGTPSFENAGTITSTGTSGDYALDLGVVAQFSNSGTITSQGAGVDLGTYSFANSGTIEAKDTAVTLQILGDAANSGTIRSSGGTGLEISGSVGTSLTNSGTIEGAGVGAAIAARLVNTGTVSSAGTGVALGSHGILENRAGATVSGGVMGVAPALSTIFNSRIHNAGTIEGDVSFGQDFVSIYNNNNIYYALDGGILDGNLTLGNGDYLVTSIDNKGEGDFAGINGTVSALNSYLRYEVTSDTSAVLALPDGFASVGYQLHGGAALTLTAPEPYTSTLLLSGVGSVDLTADITVADAVAISSTSMISAAEDASTINALDIVSHGTITSTQTNPYYYASAAVVLASGDSFTNTGTVSLSDQRSVTYNTLSAISGGTVVNSGTITADGANGISYATRVDNSGSITASGLAVYGYQNTAVTNSGTLASTGSAAIQFYSGYNSSIDNAAGGTISGGDGVAIQSSGGAVRNAGTIVGDVDLGWSSYGYSASSGTYYADGGTIDGDLLFGSGSDLLIETGSGFGVSGTIDGGNGTDTVGHVRSESGTVTLGGELPNGFENEFTGALGSDTVITITSDIALERDIQIAGNGQIVNQATTSGRLTGYSIQNNSGLLADLAGPLASLTNEADVAGGISLAVNSLTNSAVVGTEALSSTAVHQSATGAFGFVNSGTIAASEDSFAFNIYATGLTTGSFDNSGSIRGGDANLTYGFSADSEAPALSFANSGTMAIDRGLEISRDYYAEVIDGYALAFDNSGTVTSNVGGSTTLAIKADAGGTISLSNSGTIRNDGVGFESYYYSWVILPDYTYGYVVQPATVVSSAVSIAGDGSTDPASSFVNSGTIEASGALSTAIRASGALDLVNTGTISGSSGFVVTDDDWAALAAGTTRFAGAIQTFGDAADTVTNSGTITGSIDLGGGDDAIINTGTIAGDVWLGAGDDSFTQLLSAVYEGTADGGDGQDTLTFDMTGGGELNAASFAPFVNFETIALTGSGSITTEGVLPVDTLQLVSGASFELAAGSTLQTQGEVALTGSDGAETVVNHGVIVGSVALGAGDDSYVAYAGASVTGSVDGGAGSDRLAFYLADAGEERVALGLGNFANFEELAIGSGTVEYEDEVVFDHVSVEGGRLIGAAGSTLTASSGIHVASGATFGSAGTVIGNVDVAGTLSPGASPGTMTIDGNLSLASGSTTYFEVTDGQSDAISVSGTTTIEDGSALLLTGTRAYEAGAQTYTLISSTGGISGSFTTITKSEGVYGFVRQEGDSIVLTNTLLAPNGASAPIAATVANINAMMADGSGSDAFYAAVPALADASGAAYGAAIATLHPEAYASAAQVGIDNGLAIASAVRSSIEAPAHRTGVFAIGQGLGAWNELEGRSGPSDARNSLGGFLAGLGYRFQHLTLAAFAGRAYGHQSITTLDARTNTSGTVAGAAIRYSAHGLTLGGIAIWDASSATTRRTLFDASKVQSRYDLHSLTLDGYAAYSFALGSGGWKVGPQVSVTHVDTDRGASEEAGSEAFALQVSARRQQVTFVSADVRFELGGQTHLRPNLTLGVQQRVSGNALRASASFAGSPDSFTVAGAMRERTFAHVAGSVDWTVAKQVDLFAQGQIHFNGQASAETANAGIRMAF